MKKKLIKKLKKRWKISFPKKTFAVIIVLLVLTSFLLYLVVKDLPSPTKLSTANTPQSSQIFDRNGTLLYTIYGNRNETFIPLSKIPKPMQKATIAIEDRNFYNHGAIDIRGMIRAAYLTLTHKQEQGGSTLTQQLVKNSLLTQERTLPRKVKEIILSFATELIYSKDKILEMYLNQSPYGGTAYGVEAASQMYFGKSVQQIDLAQAALLAGLPQSPTTYSPYGPSPDLGRDRQVAVLDAMEQQGYITKSQHDHAVNEDVHIQKIQQKILAPHFVFYIKQLLEDRYGEQLVEEGGLHVTTSLDMSLQDTAQASVAAEVAKLKGSHVTNGAALVTDPKTGEILAMVGSHDYYDTAHDGNVNITTSLRQPGSSIKPINYVIGIMKGFSDTTPFIDQPICFPGTPAYCPHNYDNKFHGVVTLRQALGNSLNIPAVKMLKVNGIDAMLATASAMGITTFTNPQDYGLSLTLGGGEVKMTDMSVAFGVFANQGYRVDLHPILRITDKHNTVLEQYTPPDSAIFGKKVIPEGAAYIISDILADNNARMIEFGPRSSLYIPNHTVSVKTGTTNDFRDNWTIGYTPDVLVATWVGNNDNSPMQGLVSGITGAAPMWNDIMTYVLNGKPDKKLQKPPDVVAKTICTPNPTTTPGQPETKTCTTSGGMVLKGTKPPISAGVSHEAVWIDTTTNDLAKPGQTQNVKPQDEEIVTDATGDRYCLSCPHPTPTPSPTP